MNKRILGQLFEKFLVAFTVIILLISSSVILSPPTAVSSAEVSGNITLKDLPPKGHPKLDSALSALASQNNTKAIGPLTSGLAPQTAGDTVRIIIEAAKGQTNNVSASARAFGSIEGSYGDLVQMVVPISQLNTLAGLSNAKLVRLPMKPLPSVISEGVPLINADDWQLASYNGTGVKIGILDAGFSGYTTRQLEGELPAAITTWWAPSIGNAGTNIHGTACAEIVYDMAPCATYYFANFGTDVEYGNAVNWLISQGVNIISCSVGWPTGGPGDGTGFFCQVIDSAKAAGIFWAQAIGNQAQMHWEGTWTDTSGNGLHEFAPGWENNRIYVNYGDVIVAALKWDDIWGASSNDYDLLLSFEGNVVAASVNIQDGDDNPWELLAYPVTTVHYNAPYDLKIMGPSGFSKHTVASLSSSDVYATDIDGDSDTDILGTGYSNIYGTGYGVTWWENDGNEYFTEHKISNNGANSIYAADVDKDGDIDFLSANGGSIEWWENDGHQNFTEHLVAAYDGASSVYAIDVDGDNDIDIMGTATEAREVAWWENDGSENFTKHSLTTTLYDANYIYAIDIDKDTDIDILTTARGGHDLSWWENDGSENFTKHTINDVLSMLGSAYAIDMDNDGDIDVLAVGGLYAFNWWENDGHQNFTQHIIQESLPYPTSIYAADIDGDGDKDVIGSSETVSNQIIWWENDGHQNFTNHTITTGFSAVRSVYATDLNGDGRTDILAAGLGGGIAWLENNNLRPVKFHLYSYYQNLQYSTTSSSFIVPADSFSAVAVGAVDHATPTTLESFSSRGPTDDGRIIPSLVALDGVSTRTYASYSPPDFYGTSAAAPCTAGAAALVKQRFPTYIPAQIQAFLEGRAVDLGTAGKDNLYGSGRLDLGSVNNSFTLTMAVSGSGNITPDEGTYSYAQGSTISINATAASGWQFTSWTGNVTDPYSATTNVTINTDKTVTANFNQTAGTLTIIANGSGSVNPSVGSHSYTLGANVTISATPSSYWAFVNWTGDVLNNNAATTNVTMNTNKTVTANFVRTTSILRMAVSGNGTVTPGLGFSSYPVGTSVNITATPASGWQFSVWTGAVTNTSSASTNVTMDTDKTIIAIFTQIPAPAPPPPSSGGGGGGGGGGATNDTRITGLMGLINDEGKIASDVEAQSLDSKLTLALPYGTIAKNKLGVRLSSITVTTLAEPNAPPAGKSFIGSVYELGPSGATFNPPLQLTLKYKDIDIPDGLNEGKLYLATWDDTAKTWLRIEFTLDANANMFTTKIPHFSQYAILAATQTANFTLSDIKVSPAQINPGESAVVSVRVTNTGNLTGDYQVVLKINSAVQETKTVTLEASANTTVSFNLVGGKEGTYSVDIDNMHTSFTVAGKPAAFKVESFTITPAEINPGEFTSISVNVTNTGESEGKYALTLKINTKEVETKEITLSGASSQQVVFKATSDTPGKKIIEINGLIGGLNVKGEVPPPSQIPLPLANTESAVKATTTSTPQTSAPASTPEPGTTTTSNAWIFGIIAGGVLLVAACALFITWRRKRG
jgi:hypothetical protein